jgi:hypothetical protein
MRYKAGNAQRFFWHISDGQTKVVSMILQLANPAKGSISERGQQQKTLYLFTLSEHRVNIHFPQKNHYSI